MKHQNGLIDPIPLSINNGIWEIGDHSLATYFDYVTYKQCAELFILPVCVGDIVRIKEGIFEILPDYDLELVYFELKLLKHCHSADMSVIVYHGTCLGVRFTTVMENGERKMRWQSDNTSDIWEFFTKKMIGDLRHITECRESLGLIKVTEKDLDLSINDYVGLLIPEIGTELPIPAFRES